MKTKTIQEVSSDTLKLEEYVRTLAPGEKVAYLEISMATGVAMDTRGKQRLRVACKRAKRVYATIRDFGIEMSSGHNAGSISRTGLVRLDNMARKQEKVNVALLEQHAEDMPVLDRNQISTVASMFATVRVMADGHKKMMAIAKKNKPKCLPSLQAKDVLGS